MILNASDVDVPGGLSVIVALGLLVVVIVAGLMIFPTTSFGLFLGVVTSDDVLVGVTKSTWATFELSDNLDVA